MTSPLTERALALHQAGHLAPAEQLYLEAIVADAGDATARHMLGLLRSHQGRHQEALDLLAAALVLAPGDAELLSNHASMLKRLGRAEEALQNYDAALAIAPRHVETLYNRGVTLAGLGRTEMALASFDAALALRPDFALALDNRGIALRNLGRREDALASFDAALALAPGSVDALNNRGVVLRELGQSEAALASFDAALARQPGNVSALYNRGNALRDLKRFDEAFACYIQVLQLDPQQPDARDGAANAALELCDWQRRAQIEKLLRADVAAQRSVIKPFTVLCYGLDAAVQAQCAANYVRSLFPVRPAPLWRGEAYGHRKIRLAYISADFKNHPTSQLMAGLFESHDRARFDVNAISLGQDDGSAMRARLARAFDTFHDARQGSDAALAQWLRDMEIDIAIDLNIHTGGSRPGILMRRPAPVQVNHLGYPGTFGADVIDYIIGDATILPFDQQSYFAEKIVHLPDSYQVNDAVRAIATDPPGRLELGLPAEGFVFCSFNNSWKITPPVFDVWMRLLTAVPGSVLWLIQDNDGAIMHLRAEARARGVDPARLVFAPRLDLDKHLARHARADLFLDTLPVNAHTTASDALWAGLPLITCLGKHFPGRVAASLLRAIGLPELVTTSLADYEALALALARDPVRLAVLRQKLAQNRLTQPLFDTARFRAALEAAYIHMWERAERGEGPAPFAVP